MKSQRRYIAECQCITCWYQRMKQWLSVGVCLIIGHNRECDYEWDICGRCGAFMVPEDFHESEEE